MKKGILIAVMITASAASGFSQAKSLADSLMVLQKRRFVSRQVYFNQLEADRLRLVMANATQLSADSIAQAGILQTAYRCTSGGLHAAQEAYRTQETSLYTEGLATLGRMKVAGSFRVSKLWMDSLANYLGGYFDGISPYYYFATKAGKYQGQRYEMKMLLTYNLLKNKLYAGLGADYDYRWVTGSVDPRPDERMMQVDVRPSLSLRVGKILAGLEYIGGYGKGSIDIAYQNRTFNLSTLYPDRFYYLNMGYGDIALKYGVIDTRTLSNNGVGFHVAGGSGVYSLKADIAYHKEKEINHKALDTLKMSTFFSSWQVRHYTGDLLLTADKDASMQQLLFSLDLQNGSDLNSLYQGSNYFARQNLLRLHYDYQLKTTTRLQPGYGIFIDYQEGDKNDILAAHHINYSILRPGISVMLYYKQKDDERWSLRLEPSVILPLHNEYEVPSTQENVFTKAIVYPDVYYRSKQVLSTDAQLRFVTGKLLTNMETAFSLQAQWLRAFSSDNDVWLPVTPAMGHSRVVVQFGFHVFL